MELDRDEQRAFDVAHRDFINRVERASLYHVKVASASTGFVVSYERQIKPGEPMIGFGGIDNGITYSIDRSFEIAEITLPH